VVLGDRGGVGDRGGYDGGGRGRWRCWVLCGGRRRRRRGGSGAGGAGVVLVWSHLSISFRRHTGHKNVGRPSAWRW